MGRKKYYVNMQSREISEAKYGNSNYFTIYATSEEINGLRTVMDNMYEADTASFVRAHIPFVPYHNDQATANYDMEFSRAMEMLHKLGNSETKQHIETMGILPDRHL